MEVTGSFENVWLDKKYGRSNSLWAFSDTRKLGRTMETDVATA